LRRCKVWISLLSNNIGWVHKLSESLTCVWLGTLGPSARVEFLSHWYPKRVNVMRWGCPYIQHVRWIDCSRKVCVAYCRGFISSSERGSTRGICHVLFMLFFNYLYIWLQLGEEMVVFFSGVDVSDMS
jgi:hypothetical protein